METVRRGAVSGMWLASPYGSEHSACNNVALRGYKLKLFQVLHHEEDKYVVRGPNEVAEERKVTLRVDETDVTIQPHGTPVVCHGLKNTYFNGKIGDIRSFDKSTGRWGVQRLF
jgi:hypothetical protein